MAQAQQVNLPSLYAELNRLGQKQEYEKAIRIANKILQTNPDEFEAFQCKIVSLLLLGNFDEALVALNKKTHSGTLKFEKAYCEYRLNRTNEALSTLKSIANPDVRVKELLCQVLYRIEQYEECYNMFRDVIKNSEDDYDAERETNLAAVIASLQMWGVKEMDNPGLEENSYEIYYNNACYYIGKGDLKMALEKLDKAEELLKSDTDLTEEELDEELAIIRVQRGYIYQRQNKTDLAAQLYNQVLKSKPSDVGLVAVVSNNIVTINKDQNIFDSKRKIKAATGDNLKHKTVSHQRKHIDINQCLIHMYSNQSEQCLKLSRNLMEQYPELDTPILIQAAQLVRDKKTEEAAELLQDYVKTHPEKKFKTQLITAQLYLNQGSVYQACEALKDLGDLAYKPGIVSTLLTLYLSQEDKEAASEVLISAVNWYKKNNPKSPALLTLTRANADFQLKNGKPEEAAKMLEDLRKANPGDPLVVAQLISSYAQFNPSKAQEISRDLPPVSKIIEGVDVEALEASFSSIGPKYLKRQPQKGEVSPSLPSGEAKSGEALMVKKQNKKKKKGKLPKNCEPGGVVDPERWLPRRERSYYRGKRKDKRKDIGKGTQGMTAATQALADSLDASKPATLSGSEPASPRPAAASTSSPLATPSASVLEYLQACTGELRELENTYYEKMTECASYVQDKVAKNELDEEISEELKMLLFDKDAVMTALVSSHEHHMLKLDNKEDEIVTGIKTWLRNTLTYIHQEEEINRNRTRVAEINHLIEFYDNEISDLEAILEDEVMSMVGNKQDIEKISPSSVIIEEEKARALSQQINNDVEFYDNKELNESAP